jgi:hypothetical protein
MPAPTVDGALRHIAYGAVHAAHLQPADTVRARGDRRRRRRRTGVTVLAAALLAAASIGASGLAPTRVARPAPAATASPSPATGVDGRRWAGTTRFLQIRDGWSLADGSARLAVRPARREILGEGFATVPVPGPYAEVAVPPSARIVALGGGSGTVAAFVEDLAARPADRRVEGFDVTFDADGLVSRVDWLYVP